MILAAIDEHDAVVTLCLKRVVKGNHFFEEPLGCRFGFFRWAEKRVTRHDRKDVVGHAIRTRV